MGDSGSHNGVELLLPGPPSDLGHLMNLARRVTATGVERHALRLLVRRGRVAHWRPAVVAATLSARLGRSAAYAIWPDIDRPRIAYDPRDDHIAEWTRRAFERGGRGARFASAATWQMLRSRSAVIPTQDGRAFAAARAAVGRDLDSPRALLLSPSDAINKVIVFVFEDGRPEPSLVVKAMADPRRDAWLRAEVELIERLREAIADPSLKQSLPEPPLHVARDGAYLVVEQFDRDGVHANEVSTSTAHDWLGRFREATTTAVAPLTASEIAHALDIAESGWRRYSPGNADQVLANLEGDLANLAAAPVPRCAVHGDFWSGNLVSRTGGGIRVFDWEWGDTRGLPFFDLWMLELGLLRPMAVERRPELREALSAGVNRVRTQLQSARIDAGFALPFLSVSAAELVTRVRRHTGREGSWHPAAPYLLETVGRLMSTRNSLCRS
jgi:hypothetical protein